MVLLEDDIINSSETEEEPSLDPDEERKRESTHTNRPRNNINIEHQENVELLLRKLLEGGKRLWQQLKMITNFVMVDLGGYQLFDRVIQWSVQNPQTALCLLAAGLVTFLPILIIVGVGLSTIVMTFTGFLVLEGTLLTILSMMLFGLLGALAIVFLFFALLALAAYFGFAHIYDLYGNVESHKLALRRFLQNENPTHRSRRNTMDNSGQSNN